MTSELLCEEGFVRVEKQALAYKRWRKGSAPGFRILALHGWLDNAASFDALMQHLDQHDLSFDCLAMDAPGHGYSDHKPEQGSYNIWDDVRGLLGVLDEMAWSDCILLCHSRGAFIGSLLAVTSPERVTGLIALDSLIPDAIDSSAVVDQLRRHIRDYRRQGRRAPGYDGPDMAIQALVKKTAMSEAAARTLVQRGLVCEDGDEGLWRWRSDPRLLSASALKFTAEQWQVIFQAIECPVFLITASRGMGCHPEFLQRWLGYFADLHHESIDGSHHSHLDPDTAGDVATRVAGFLTTIGKADD